MSWINPFVLTLVRGKFTRGWASGGPSSIAGWVDGRGVSGTAHWLSANRFIAHNYLCSLRGTLPSAPSPGRLYSFVNPLFLSHSDRSSVWLSEGVSNASAYRCILAGAPTSPSLWVIDIESFSRSDRVPLRLSGRVVNAIYLRELAGVCIVENRPRVCRDTGQFTVGIGLTQYSDTSFTWMLHIC